MTLGRTRANAQLQKKVRRLFGWLPALLMSAAPSAHAQAATALATSDDHATLTNVADDGGVVVTARNRAEKLNDVPIPISVVSAETIAQQRVFTIADLTQRAPGFTATTPNARRTGVSLRGIGKTSGNDNMEAAVGTIVDDVFLGHVGMTYQDFTDLAQVEVLRGPQGTLLGKNTSLGVIKYTTKRPTFTPEGTFEIEKGLSQPSFKSRASYSNALIENTLAYRASFFVDKQEGDILNVNPTIGGHWHERDRWGGRLQVLYEKGDNFSLLLNADSAETNENSNTKPFMFEPATLNDGSLRTITYSKRLARDWFGGYTPIIGSWDTIDMDQALPLITRNKGASLVATWNVGGLELKSITAARSIFFDAKNDSEQTRFEIARGGTLVDTQQYSQEFRATGNLTPKLDYQGGVYLFRIATDTTSRNLFGKDAAAFYATDAQYATLSATPAGRLLLQSALDKVYSTSYQNPISDSQAVFGQFNYAATDKFTLTAGLRYTWEQKTNAINRSATKPDGSPLVSTGNATADAVRLAQTSTPFNLIEGTPIDDGAVSWLVNPSYKLTSDILLYASASGGGKSGAVAFDSNGVRRNVTPEKATDYELGVKGQFFDDALSVSANLYYTKVRDYQSVTSEADPTSATGFSSRLGNIPEIRAQGVELEGNWRISRAFSINFGGAYNDAIYTDWSTATCPREYPTTTAVCNNTGKQIVGAPKWNAILGFNFEQEIGASGVSLLAFANDTYRSSQNLEQLLSSYGVQKDYHITDAGIGLAKSINGRRTELNVVAKNLFDEKYTTSVNDFSNNAPVGYDGIGPRRYVGVLLRTQL